MKLNLAILNSHGPDLDQVWRLVCKAENEIALLLADYPLGTAVIGRGEAWYLCPDSEGTYVLVHAEFDGDVFSNPRHRFELEAIFETPEEGELIDYHLRLIQAKEAFCLVPVALPACIE